MATDGCRLAGRLDRLEAIAAIERLVAEYSHGADKQQLDRFLAVWHADAVWDVGTRKFTGLEEIRQAVETQWTHLAQMHHWTSNLSIDIEPGATTATAECDVNAFVEQEGGWVHSAGSYLDAYELRSGEWKISSREARVHFTREVEAAGPGH